MPKEIKKPRETEAELCAAFIAWAERQGWTSYAETAGWDILLSHRGNGCQIGVQAKVAFNATLLRQTMPERKPWREQPGPDYRAILLPRFERDIGEVCSLIGLIYFRHDLGWRDDNTYGAIPAFKPSLTELILEDFDFWEPAERIKLPDYVPDVVAGASGPVQLTAWKIRALRITAILTIRGYVTADDFRDHSIDRRRWLISNWIRPEHLRVGRYVRGSDLYFDKQHPRVFGEIMAEVAALLAQEPHE
jgi:hypothetical protein